MRTKEARGTQYPARYRIEHVTLQCYDSIVPSIVPPSRSTSLHTEAAGTAPPDAFGPFRVLHQIGAGALGPVFRAYDPDQDRLVAVKLFRLDVPPDRVHRFVTELQQLIDAHLTHQAIATPIMAGIVRASAYLAQDFVAADSLDIVMREHGSAPAADAVRVATQVAGALDFAATVNVVHGALHPRDVLIASDDTRLIGLGITRALEHIGFPAPVRRPYTAPERAAGAAWDRRADVFGLAALIYELLWARRVAATGREAVAGLSRLPGVDSDALSDVFARGLAEDPADRFETGLQFAEALKEAIRSPLKGGRYRGSGMASSESLLPLGEPDPEGTVDEGTVSIRRLKPDDDDTVPTGPSGLGDDDDAVPSELAVLGAESAGATPEPGPVPFARPMTGPMLSVDSVSYPTPPRALAALVRPAVLESNQRPLKASQSAIWPLTLALVIGMALGFGGGYWLGGVERANAPVSTLGNTSSQLPAAGGPRAQESNEVTASAVATDTTSGPGARDTEVLLKPDATREASGAVAPSGRLTVRSMPAGARVLVDGRDVGTTPVTVGKLTRGTHAVRVLHDGYVAQERRASITAGRPSPSLTVRLTRADAAARTKAPASRLTASLAVESRPSGARVLLDGKLVGTTPMLIDAVPAGVHAVRLDLNGYRRWTSSVGIAAGEKHRVAGSLER